MSMAYPGLTHCIKCEKGLNGGIGICDSCHEKRKKAENVENTYKIKTMEVGGDIYENIELPSRRELLEAIVLGRVIAIREKGKKIYISGRYIVSFEE